MSLVKFIASPYKREFPCITKRYLEAVSPTAYDRVVSRRQNTACCYWDTLLQSQQRRLFHATDSRRDMEGAVKAVGAGIAAVGVIGPGVGLGLIFGNMLQGISRNPSAANKIFQFGILGAALCESVAFFALMVSFIALS